MIPVECSSCGAEFQVPDSAAGKMVRCRRCDGVTTVPVIEEYSEDFTEEPDWFDVEDARRESVEELAWRMEQVRQRLRIDPDDPWALKHARSTSS